MRLLLMLAVGVTPTFACACARLAAPDGIAGGHLKEVTACSGIKGDAIVFAGRVLANQAGENGRHTAQVSVEEALWNVPEGTKQFELAVQFPPSDCSFDLQTGQRYVLFARKNGNGMLAVNACSHSFKLDGNEPLLDALRNEIAGGSSRLLGRVFELAGQAPRGGGLPGVTVKASSGEESREAITDASGAYEFRDVPPGRYLLEVAKPGFVPDLSYNQRWFGEVIFNRAALTAEDDNSNPGTVVVSPRSCEVRDLRMLPATSAAP